MDRHMKIKKEIKKTPPPKPKPRRKQFNLYEFATQNRFALILIGVGILLRFIDLGRQSLWIDEMCTWNDALSSFERIMRTVHKLVFLMQKASLSIGGQTEFFLRLPSALGGLLALIFIYPLASILQNRRAALFALILLVFSPINIYYSQDSNYYGLMMGLTTVSLYFLFLFMKDYNPLWLLIFGAFAYANYHVHPTNILLIACQLMPLGLFLIFNKGMWERYHHLLNKLTADKVVFGIAIGIVVLAVAYIALRMFRFIHRMAITSYGTVLAENLELTPRFFVKLAMDYGVAFQQYIPYIFFLTMVLLIFFFMGLWRQFKTQRYFALFLILSWTLPFIAIYIKKIGHFYHCRYTSFIVPGFIVAAACGIDHIGEWLERRFNYRAAMIALGGIFVLLFTGIAPNLVRYYTGEKQDWKGAVEYLRKNLKEGEKVASHIFCNDSSLRFYYKYFNMDPSPIVKLSGEFRGSAYVSLFRLKKLCFTEPGVYFATSYTRYEDTALWSWAKNYFDVVFHQPSLHPEEFNREGKEVILYKFKYSGAFVFPPYHYTYKPQVPIAVSGEFSKELLFGAAGAYRIAFHVADKVNDGDWSIAVQPMSGSEISEKAEMVKADNGAMMTCLLNLTEGVQRIKLVSPNKSAADSIIQEIQISPEISGEYRREAEDTDLYHPTAYKRIEQISGALAFTLERDGYLFYDRVPFNEGGQFGFTLRALEDKPGPVFIEVALDWSPLGILMFEKGDNTWSEKTFPFNAPAGEHTISLHFISPPGDVERLVGGKMPSDRLQDTDASFDYFTIRPLNAADTFDDMRIPLQERLLAPTAALSAGYKSQQSPLALANGWNMEPSMTFDFPQDEFEHPGAIRITIPPKELGLNMMSPVFPVQAGNLLYFSTWMKVEHLNNHSANMKVVYLDKNNQPISMNIMNAEGLTGETGWVRQVYFRGVPNGAERAVILFWVYGNSIRVSTGSGTLWFAPIRFEKF